MRAIYPFLRVAFANQVILADDLGREIVDAALRRTGQPGRFVFENRDIRAVVEPPHPKRERG